LDGYCLVFGQNPFQGKYYFEELVSRYRRGFR